jgi:hypothetical protein
VGRLHGLSARDRREDGGDEHAQDDHCGREDGDDLPLAERVDECMDAYGEHPAHGGCPCDSDQKGGLSLHRAVHERRPSMMRPSSGISWH